MKKMKKILALFLALVTVLGMSVTAFAEGESESSESTTTTAVGKSTDRAEIKVTGIDENDLGKVTVTAYPVIKATYGKDGNFNGYEVLYTTDPKIELTVKSDKSYEYELSQEQIAQIRANLNESEKVTLDENADGSYSADAAIGAYLVVVANSGASTYNAMVVSTNYKNDNGQNAIDLSKNTAAAKKSDKPDLTKVIVKNGEEVKGSTENIGDTVSYKVTINPIPEYTGKYPVLKVDDTLSSGLTYTTDSLKVKIGDTELVEGTGYTLTVEGQKITVNFVVDGSYTLNDYKGKEAVITYDAVVNSNAKLNEVGNNNDAVLTYSKDSSIQNDDGTDEEKTHTYTFDIDGNLTGQGSTGEYTVNVLHILNKIGEEVGTYTDKSGNTVSYKMPLEGATFTVYTDATCTDEYKYTNTNFQGTVESDENGQLHITGLEAGNYWIKETSAPAGYSLNDTPIKVQINATIDAVTGELTAWNVKINDEEGTTFSATSTKSDDGTVTWTRTETTVVDGNHEGYNISNTRINELPSTGGIGTTIFTIAGCAIMIAAAGFFFANRKKRV